jgi:hypothetical protein
VEKDIPGPQQRLQGVAQLRVWLGPRQRICAQARRDLQWNDGAFDELLLRRVLADNVAKERSWRAIRVDMADSWHVFLARAPVCGRRRLVLLLLRL